MTSLGDAETSPSVVLFDGLQVWLQDAVTDVSNQVKSYMTVTMDCVQARAEALGKDISPDMKAQLQDAYAKLGYHRLSDAAKEI